MARPRKTGLDYFPFDVGFFEDEKIACIAGEFGIKGEVIAIRLLCAVYKDKGYFAEWNEQMMYKLARETQGVSAQLVEQIVRRLVKWGFFDSALFDSASILTSPAIQRRYFEAVRLRKIDVKSLQKEYILDPKIINSLETGVSSLETGVSNVINPLNKIKDKKIEDKSSTKKVNAEEDEDELRKMVDDYKSRGIWLTDMMRKFKISKEDLLHHLDDFYLDMRCKEIKVGKLSGVFIPWLTSKLNSENENRPQEDRFSRRRGTNASDWRPEDFTDTL